MKDMRITIRIRLGRGKLVAAFAAALLFVCFARIAAEKLTMTTSYPSPVGVYRTLTTTQGAVFARDSGNVGIGVTNPDAKLVVGGGLRAQSILLTPQAADPAAPVPGQMWIRLP